MDRTTGLIVILHIHI